jgi:hypothetical protein
MTNFITDDLINANVRSKWSTSASAAGTSFTPIDFDSVHPGMAAIGNWTNDGAGTITMPAKGSFRFTVGILATTSIAGNIVIYVYKNGSAVGSVGRGDSTGTNNQRLSGSLTVDCEKGDTVYITHNDAGGFSLDNNTVETFLEIVRVADYSAGEPAGFGLATETQAGLVKKPLRSYATSIYNTVNLADGTVVFGGDFSVTGLTIGRKYRIFTQIGLQNEVGNVAGVRWYDDGANNGSVQHQNYVNMTSSSVWNGMVANLSEFIAVRTTLTPSWNGDNDGNNGVIRPGVYPHVLEIIDITDQFEEGGWLP